MATTGTGKGIASLRGGIKKDSTQQGAGNPGAHAPVKSILKPKAKKAYQPYTITPDASDDLRRIQREMSPFYDPLPITLVLEWVARLCESQEPIKARLEKFLSHQSQEGVHRGGKRTGINADERLSDFIHKNVDETPLRGLTLFVRFVIEEWDWIKTKVKFTVERD